MHVCKWVGSRQLLSGDRIHNMRVVTSVVQNGSKTSLYSSMLFVYPHRYSHITLAKRTQGNELYLVL